MKWILTLSAAVSYEIVWHASKIRIQLSPRLKIHSDTEPSGRCPHARVLFS